MILDDKKLVIDIKVTDKARQRLSELINNGFKATCVILGDSDIEYELAPNVSKTRILNAPFAPQNIKHKLIYNGVGKNLDGVIKCFARKVLSNGAVQSLYNYNVSEVWSDGTTPPILLNGKDWDIVTFDNSKMGYILFFQTVLDFYLTDDNKKKALKEKYDITIDWNGSTTPPSGWDFVIDNTNGSLLLSKDFVASPVSLATTGKITITGQFSKKVKEVQFNF